MEREAHTQLTVHATPHGGNGVLVTVAGELDMAVADELYNLVLKQLSAGRNLVLDFAGLTFCDSSGIRCLVQIKQHQIATNAGFQIVNLTHRVRRVIEFTGLADYFDTNRPPAGS